jgi:tetratricopeptide (TPR) repeat protein
MKKIMLSAVGLLLSVVVHGQTIPTELTPAQQQIAWAQSEIRANNGKAQPYNDLAVAYVRRARETGDSSYLDLAQTAVQSSTERVSNTLEARKAKTMILLARGQFEEALETARALNKETPDDLLTYGFVADAATALGNYDEAERATQWMLDLRQGNVPGLLRAARMRYVYGDTAGAMDLYSQAYQQIPPTQMEDQAWTLTQMAETQLSAGHLDEADSLLHSALKFFPDYYLALESSARMEMNRGQYSLAIETLRRRNANFPTLSSLYELAKILERSEHKAEAEAAYRDFQLKAESAANTPGNANRELVLYYLGHGDKKVDALRLAELEIARRHDVFTLDAYAAALYANGRYEEAKKQIDSALSFGVRDAAIFYHAGVIAEKRQDHATALRYLKGSLEVDPLSEVASAAQDALLKASAASVRTSNAD